MMTIKGSAPEVNVLQDINETSRDTKKEDGTKVTTQTIDGDVGNAQKVYSNRSICFMVLFSGLAIGSDAYNSALMGQLGLLLAVIYPETLSVATSSQLTNAFIIGLILGMRAFGFVSDRLGRNSGAVLTTLFLSIGIIMSAVPHGTSDRGLFWMLTILNGNLTWKQMHVNKHHFNYNKLPCSLLR